MPALALAAPGHSRSLLSYGRLEQHIYGVSRKASELGLARGQIVAVFVMDPILHAVILLGLTRLGVITLSGRNPNLPRSLKIAALITDTSYPYQVDRIIRADA